jgi:hypothetical protein
MCFYKYLLTESKHLTQNQSMVVEKIVMARALGHLIIKI